MKASPTAERLLSTLIDLYADQKGVTVSYTISDSEGGENNA